MMLKSTYQFTKDLINSKQIGQTITKNQLSNLFFAYYSNKTGLTSTYRYISVLISAGYLQTISQGTYAVVKHVPDNLTFTEIKKGVHTRYELRAKEILDDKVYGYLKLISGSDMSFIQGRIFEIMTYKQSIENLNKIIELCNFAIANKHYKALKSNVEIDIFTFCIENAYSDLYSTIANYMYNNKYSAIVELCKQEVENCTRV